VGRPWARRGVTFVNAEGIKGDVEGGGEGGIIRGRRNKQRAWGKGGFFELGRWFKGRGI